MADDAERVSIEAAIWLARLERGLQPQEGAMLRQWLQRPAQRDAIVETAKLSHGADIVAVLAELVPVGFGPPRRPKRKIVNPIVLGVLACVAVVFLMPVLRALRPKGSAPITVMPWEETVYTTRPGETRIFTLQDGSRLILNSHTRVGILLAARLRQAIVAYGEAIFQIAPERQRSFEVNAGGRHFQAPASMFDIRVINPRSVELLVIDGGVTVRGLPWHLPQSPAEARMFDPAVFADTTVGPLQTALIQDDLISRNRITAANAEARLRWQPEDILYVTP